MSKKDDKKETRGRKKKVPLQPNPFREGLDKGGRPRKYEDTDKDVKLFNDRIAKYFDYIQGEGTEEEEFDKNMNKIRYIKWTREREFPTINGLSLFLGFCNKSTLYDYESKPMFSNSIKRARAIIEKHYESNLNLQSATGSIFALKNFGWKDKQEIEHTDKRKDVDEMFPLEEELVENAESETEN